jgi:hypothetical protein
MTSSNRRVFIFQAITTSAALLSTRAMAQAKLDEKDPQALALGYLNDTTKVDGKKYPKHAPTQRCANCQLYAGKPTDAAAACPLFAGKQVAGSGWCTAYVKKT